MKGRALIDLPAHGLKCGEYGDLPKAVASAYIKAGHFDPKAVQNPGGAVTNPAETSGTGSGGGGDAGDAGDPGAGAGAAAGDGGEGGADDDAGSAQAGTEA
jgi:hypothetical protein